jgi:hypothetical protein
MEDWSAKVASWDLESAEICAAQRVCKATGAALLIDGYVK